MDTLKHVLSSPIYICGIYNFYTSMFWKGVFPFYVMISI